MIKKLNLTGLDKDGLLMLFLSSLLGVISLGLIWLFYFRKSYLIAKKHFPPPCHDVWVVFGKKLTSNQIDKDFKMRLDSVLRSKNLNLPKKVILLGGFTNDNTISESEAAKKHLNFTEKKFKFKLILESSSQNTLQNLQGARAYLQSKKLPLQICLVSNRYHLCRCIIMAENMGFTVECLPAEKKWKFNRYQFTKLSIEAFFLNSYFTGKFLSQKFNNKRMLDKIR